MKKVKHILTAIWLFITNLWNKVDKIVEKFAPLAIEVVETIKTINDSTTGDIIEKILNKVIPGSDLPIVEVRSRLRVILPAIIMKLNLSSEIAKLPDANSQLKAILAAINMSPNEARNAYYHALAAMILEALSDKKLTWSEAVQIAEYYYTNIYKKK